MLGVNARLPLDAETAARVAAMNASGVPILALDIATGCDPTTAELGETHVRAVATVALGRPKLGSMLEPGRDATGDLWCAPLGMRGDDAGSGDVDAFFMTNDDFDALLPRRSDDSEKRSVGRAADHRGLGAISRRRGALAHSAPRARARATLPSRRPQMRRRRCARI